MTVCATTGGLSSVPERGLASTGAATHIIFSTPPPHAGPLQVTINALENSVSIASLILTTESLVTDLPKKEAGPGAGGHEDY